MEERRPVAPPKYQELLWPDSAICGGQKRESEYSQTADL